MIEIVCDKCESTLEVDDELAGQKVECPKCGDVNLVPGRARTDGARVREDRASAAGYPPDSGPEQTVMKVRPAMMRARPFLFGALALVLLAGIGAAAWGGYDGPVWLAWVGAAGAGVALVALAAWKMQTLAAALVVTNKRTVEHRGLFSRSTSEVVHDNIRNVQIRQTFWQRVWGVGEIGISSAGQDGIEVAMNHVPNPNEVRRVIDLYRPLD